MNVAKLDDTIVAISTPIGEGGIGIVRLSGKDALKIADRVFFSKNGRRPSQFKTYTVHYGHIIDQRPKVKDQRQKKGIADEVILTVMRAPKSYTKEDVVEINCHSGIVPLKKILDLVLVNGARLAEPGEFTKRAFLNGRIDILQAEAVLDIIRAKTDLSLRAALNSLEGMLSKRINDIRERLIDILAHSEATIDFSEEEEAGSANKNSISNRLSHISKEIERLISKGDEGRILRQGIKAVICGSPNVGKSSLMNSLLRESRVIVTDIPGTTRDAIEEMVNIKGISVVLMDTAGITDTMHPVDKKGVEKSYSSLEKADLILLVLDGSRKINKNDVDIIRKLIGRPVLIIVNKIDLPKKINLNVVEKYFKNIPIVYISCLNQSGIGKLEKMVHDIIFKGKAPSGDLIASCNERQLDILWRSNQDIKDALGAFKKKIPMDCISIYIRSGIESLGEITGHTITEEALDRIFSEFCIGK